MSGFIQNIAITLLPVLIYQVYWSKIQRKPELTFIHKILIGVVSSISIVLSMTYPFFNQKGMVFDLRLIPLAISILYGEYSIGIFTLLVLVLYRYYLGGPGVAFAIIVESILSIFFFLFVNKYKKYSNKKRPFVGVALLMFVLCIKCLLSFTFIPNFVGIIHYRELLLFFFTHFCIMFLNLYLIERSRYQVLIEEKIHLSEKHQVVSHLAASIAHEIRNPLTVIRGFLQFIDDSTDPTKFLEYRNLMLEELGRAEQIINDYLTLAKPEIGHKETMHASELIGIALNIANSFALTNNIELKSKLEEGLYISVEKSKLIQVLVNILKNAVESMPNGGIIYVSVRRVSHDVHITILDQGVGMTEEQIHRLGQPYYSTKDKGTGLGLMVSYKIIEMMKGRIEVKSTKGVGTEFTIAIPLAVEKVQEAPKFTIAESSSS